MNAIQCVVVGVRSDLPAFVVERKLARQNGGAQVVALAVLAALSSETPPECDERGVMRVELDTGRGIVRAQRLPPRGLPVWTVTENDDDAPIHIIEAIDLTREVRQ